MIEPNTPKAVVLLSGGMDSTTLLYSVRTAGYQAIGLSVAYGQRHSIELAFAQRLSGDLGIRHYIVDLENLKSYLSASALTGDIPVPEGHYTADNMAQTVVPNRNAILLAIAFGFAVTEKAVKVCTAVHAGDHAIYPDCRPGFIKAFEAMQREAITREIYGIKCPDLYVPFLNMTKAQICKLGSDLGVPWERTWSCYNGTIPHCGRCGTCVERIEAFRLAGVSDPTQYQDTEFADRVLLKG